MPAEGTGPAENAGTWQMTGSVIPDGAAEEPDPEYDPPAGADHSGVGNEQENNPGISENNPLLLQSASVDLDGDGENEQVEAIQVEHPPIEGNLSGELEGRLIIKSTSGERQISFWKKQPDYRDFYPPCSLKTWIMTAQRCFSSCAGLWSSIFLLNYFIYSYKKNLSYSFASDNMLAKS